MKKGISLISLIITIIVIIILAAIVIFSGLNTPDSASFAGFTQQVDNVYQAVMNKYGDLKAKHAISGHYRTDEQIYIEIAVADDPDQYATMGTTSVTNFKSGTKIENSTGIQNIQVGAAMNREHSIGMTLPKVRESNTAWYVTKEGKVFNANGYIYDGKTYFSGSLYQGNELPANETSNANRAYYIYEAIKNDTNVVENAQEIGSGEVITGGSITSIVTNVTHPGVTPVTGDEVTITLNGHTDNYYYVKDNIYLAKYSLPDSRQWTSDTKPWSTRANGSYPYDLNNDVENNESEYGENNPYVEARTYGKARLRTGRLLTAEEYNYLKDNSDSTQWEKIYKNDDTNNINGRSWWLGSAMDERYVHRVKEAWGGLGRSSTSHSYAVRPVIEL